MSSKVESEVNVYSQELDKFAARWHQLKPRDEMMDEDKHIAVNALASLRERRAEFDELLKSSNRLR